jgi:hypothetical protein
MVSLDPHAINHGKPKLTSAFGVLLVKLKTSKKAFPRDMYHPNKIGLFRYLKYKG